MATCTKSSMWKQLGASESKSIHAILDHTSIRFVYHRSNVQQILDTRPRIYNIWPKFWFGTNLSTEMELYKKHVHTMDTSDPDFFQCKSNWSLLCMMIGVIEMTNPSDFCKKTSRFENQWTNGGMDESMKSQISQVNKTNLRSFHHLHQ